MKKVVALYSETISYRSVRGLSRNTGWYFNLIRALLGGDIRRLPCNYYISNEMQTEQVSAAVDFCSVGTWFKSRL